MIYEVIEQGAFGKTTIAMARDGQETWVKVTAGNRGEIYVVTVVEKQGMKQDVVSAATRKNQAWMPPIPRSGELIVKVDTAGVLNHD